MRAIWQGHVVFGLISVPVRLFAATEEGRPALHLVHECGGRIRHRRVCEREGREVPEHEVQRGAELPDGRTVVLAQEDLAHLPLATKREVDVLGFVDEADVDPIMYWRPYYAAPNGAAAGRPYALLVEALARSGRVAVCKVALRSRERLAVLRPRRGILVVHTLWWPAEIRDPGDVSVPAPVSDRELALADMLIEQLVGVDIDGLHDEYAHALEQVIVAKLEGHGWAEPPEPEEAVDLMAALEASLRQARQE
jgi:DNA end-binding protein Ku